MDGFDLGALCVIHTQPHGFTAAERAALIGLATTVMDLIAEQ
jgi:GAF domain-containing protein